ncbi:DUF6952 family protein [Aureibacter tunicatorum]|uniref:Uncharacterized protein n=1 Tax=Aureibacter tunicatorum TaxID=866807 RepID=A0AAE4BT98_9BACT|nr:hypothetical protein [Aureibacter tunicatorum]MDR6239725.1 hypothetical protein [Aureibacter tunicatorum]BDD04201.1 hypothetical protein AUTU_16840 [Aureibacter tunicatorum]
MHIPSIKKIVEEYTLEELKAAEQAFENGEDLSIEVPGNDEGEQFTHIIAGVSILEDMQNNKTDFKTALRAYTQKVRNSIN